MKKSLIVLAMMAAFGAHAQNSASGSSTSSSTSSPTITSGNSGAESSSASVSNPNNQANQQIQLNTYTPDRVEYDNTSTSTSRSEVIQSGSSTQNINYSGSQKVKNVPGIAMSGPASGPCTGASGGLGVAGPGFGVGINGSEVDDSCVVRENTRTLGQVYQALDSADPLKTEAKAAMMEGMSALRNMTAAIASKDKYQPKPKPVQKAEVVAPAPVVAAAPAPATKPTTQVAYTGNDPYVKARMGIK